MKRVKLLIEFVIVDFSKTQKQMKFKYGVLFISLLIATLPLFAFQANITKGQAYEVEKSDNAVTIYLDTITIKVEFIGKSILHIKKHLPGEKIITVPDYVTVLKPQNIKWRLTEKKNEIIVETETLKAIISDKGVIQYFTKDNKKLTSECNDVTYIKPDNNDGNKVSQSFVAGDEGIYGLGQFQSGIMDWKNVPVRLTQDNQEIANPFIVSTNSYGIYWHNYSISDFNVPQHELLFTKTLNEEKKIREAIFKPTKTGVYSFMLESNTQNERSKKLEAMVEIDSDTIINYSTYWAPVCFAGKKYLEAGKSYKVVIYNTNAKELGKLFYNEPDFNKTVFSSSTGNSIDYYFIYGVNPTKIISEFQHLTGTAPMFPKSAYGFWQCRERYHTQAELFENAAEYRKRGIPVDNIVQDWFYWPKGTQGPEWDRAKYPNPKGMVDELNNLNMKLMVSVWPQVNNDSLLSRYDLGRFIMKGTRFLDFTDVGVQNRFYKMLSDSMFRIGVSSIWLDGTEPENRPALNYQTTAGPFGEVANVYSLLVTKAVYEGRRKEFPKQRVFNLTRSAYAGQQRNGVASWSGDISGTWKQFSEQIAGGLNFVMTGIPYWTNDVGGFFRDSKSLNPIYDSQYTNPEYKELLTRWFQFGTFNPIFRIHGYVSNTEVWRYGKEFEAMATKYINLRYQLMPYIYSEAWKVTNKSDLMMAPMVYQYPNDKNTWGIKDQFFFGKSLLVCPVVNYKERVKEVYLPAGGWFNFWTNEAITGNRKIKANAALDQIPVFVKAGTILPIGPKVQYAAQKTKESLRIKIYPGKDAEFTLYLDDNESYNYEKGVYSELVFSYSEAKKEITIKNGKGKYIDFSKNPMVVTLEMIGKQKQENAVFSGTEIIVKL